jgi:hypothetical protein
MFAPHFEFSGLASREKDNGGAMQSMKDRLERASYVPGHIFTSSTAANAAGTGTVSNSMQNRRLFLSLLAIRPHDLGHNVD